MKSFSFYRTLDDLDSDDFGYAVSDWTSIGHDGTYYEMKTSGSSGTIDDGNGGKTIMRSGMTLGGKVSVDNPSALFGNKGLASPDTKLGIAAVCSSPISGCREAFPICSIQSDSKSFEEQFTIPIAEGSYRERLSILLVLYIETPCDSDRRMGLMSGMILGTVFSCEFKIGSEKFLFPVHEIEIPGEPLWKVRCYWTSIEDPLSSEYVCIVFNKAHKSYHLLDENSKCGKAMLAEVMCSSMQIIIEKIRQSPEEWKNVVSDTTLPNNSIGFMVQYLRNTYSWDFTSPESLSISIHNHVYGKLGLRR